MTHVSEQDFCVGTALDDVTKGKRKAYTDMGILKTIVSSGEQFLSIECNLKLFWIFATLFSCWLKRLPAAILFPLYCV